MAKPKLAVTRPTSRKTKTDSVRSRAKEAHVLDEGEARLVVNLPSMTHRKLKVHAAHQGTTIRALILNILETEMAKWK